MDEKILNTVVEHRKLFVPSLFTNKQVDILHKYASQETLNNTERAYLYSAIKKKIDALKILREEFYVFGEGMLPERIEQAKQILKEIGNKRAFISGSFLYQKNYNDIDIYILAKKRKSLHLKNRHLTYLTEKDLRKPLFFSSFKYSVANFSISKIKPEIKKPNFDEIIGAYEMSINEVLDNDDQKTVRDVLFEYYLHVKNIVLNSFLLSHEFSELKTKKTEEKISLINRMVKELLLSIYSKTYLYNRLGPFLKSIQKMSSEYKTNDNLLIYIKCLGEIKNECRRA